MNHGFVLLLLMLSVACLPVDGVASPPLDPHACGGEAPTRWHLATVAPMLPAWQQHPDRLAPIISGVSHVDQGTIALDAFSDMNLEQLVCWADNGDKLAALAADVRLDAQTQPRFSTGQVGLPIVERYLRMAARDESPAGPCAAPFCHGVPEAMYRLAYYRRVRDDEWRTLMERARDAGFTLAIYDLRRTTPPIGRH